jgi:hypothetical protein
VDTVVRTVRPVVDGVEGVGASATTLAYGVTGDVAPFAYGVGGEVAPFAHGVTGQAAPFAQDLTGTVQDTAHPLVGHALTGTEGLAGSVTPDYVQDVQNAQNVHHGSTYRV